MPYDPSGPRREENAQAGASTEVLTRTLSSNVFLLVVSTGGIMKKNLLIAAALILVLTGCAGPQMIFTDRNPRLHGYSQLTVTAPNPTAPNLFIVGSEIVVDQEPIRPVPGNDVTIYFGLPDMDPNYVFQPNGIQIHEQPQACTRQGDWVFYCHYTRPPAGTPPYKYKVRIKASQGVVHDLDPTIMN